MKITAEIPESDLRAIWEFTGIQKETLPFAKFLMKHAEISNRFLSGEWADLWRV